MLMPNQTENIDASDPLCVPDTFVEGIASITQSAATACALNSTQHGEGTKRSW